MSSINKEAKKTKPKQIPQQDTNPLAEQLKKVVKSLNQFLKTYFDKSFTDVSEYGDCVKQYFLEQSTNQKYTCLISSLFSKISNMLQPFLQSKPIKYDVIDYKLHEQVSILSHKMEKQEKKIKELKLQLNKYKEVSSRLTNFIYMLRVSNIDVDTLYQKGCEQRDKRQSNHSIIERELSQESNTQFLRKKQLQNYQTR